MGDRVLITFCANEPGYSPCIYMHWRGAEAAQMIRDAQQYMRKADPTYAAARFCGECHKAIPGALSLGILDAPPEDADTAALTELSHGDAGLYVVNVETGEVTCYGGYGDNFKLPADGWAKDAC